MSDEAFTKLANVRAAWQMEADELAANRTQLRTALMHVIALIDAADDIEDRYSKAVLPVE